MIKKYNDKVPSIDEKAFIIGESFIGGDVLIKEYASIWNGVSIRGDVDRIEIGKRTNIQDGSVLHCDQGSPLIIGDDVTVGHGAILHGCRIGNRVLVGISATVLNGVVIEDEVFVGAGSLVSPNKVLKSGFLYLGSPAKPVRPLTDEEKAHLKESALHYIQIAGGYQDNHSHTRLTSK